MQLINCLYMEITKEILEQVLDTRFEAQTKSIDSKFEAQTKAFDAKIEAQTKSIDSKFEAQTKAFDAKIEAQSKLLMAHSEGLQEELARMVADEVVERLDSTLLMGQGMQKLESQMVEIREALHLSPSR